MEKSNIFTLLLQQLISWTKLLPRKIQIYLSLDCDEKKKIHTVVEWNGIR